jgi:hypothetical protein
MKAYSHEVEFLLVLQNTSLKKTFMSLLRQLVCKQNIRANRETRLGVQTQEYITLSIIFFRIMRCEYVPGALRAYS